MSAIASLKPYLESDLSSQLQRAKEFAKNQRIIVVKVALDSAIYTLLGAWFGHIAGAGVGIAVPVTAPIAPNAGLAIGAAVGAYFGTKYVVIEIQESTVYTEWRAKAIASKAFAPFKELCESEELKLYRCHLTKELISLPVKDSQGHLWESSAILKHLDEHGGSTAPHPLDPTLKITKAELKLDLSYHNTVQKILAELKKKNEKPIDPNATAGIEAYLGAVRADRAGMLTSAIKSCADSAMQGGMSREKFAEQAAVMYDTFVLS
ncbi:MAG TPA: hypothetical protein VGM34_04220 [Chlamydiales bacterium]|jgi:hypothetical protein